MSAFVPAPMLYLLAAMGVSGGFLSGLLGIGGGLIMVPMLLYGPPLFGLPALTMKQVAAVSMVQVFFAALSGAVAHGRGRMVHRGLVLSMGLSIMAGSFIGAVGSRYMAEAFLLGGFGALAVVGAALMLVPRPDNRESLAASEVRVSLPGAAAAALLVGLVAGAVGIGGAFVLVPIMVSVLSVPTRVAIGSSLPIVLFSSVAGVLGKALSGQVDPVMAAALVIGALPGAQLGAVVSRRTPARSLRGILGAVIAVSGVRVWMQLFGL